LTKIEAYKKCTNFWTILYVYVLVVVSQSALERHSSLRSCVVACSVALRQQLCLFHAALLSSDLLPFRPTIQRPRREYSLSVSAL